MASIQVNQDGLEIYVLWPDEYARLVVALQDRDNLRAKVEALKDILHRDRSGLAEALGKCRDIARQWGWMVTGRGSYEWDDDEYKKEAGRLIKAVTAHCTTALEKSGNLVHAECCGRTRPAETLAAKGGG